MKYTSMSELTDRLMNFKHFVLNFMLHGLSIDMDAYGIEYREGCITFISDEDISIKSIEYFTVESDHSMYVELPNGNCLLIICTE